MRHERKICPVRHLAEYGHQYDQRYLHAERWDLVDVVLVLHPEPICEGADALEEAECDCEIFFGFDASVAVDEVAAVASEGTGYEVQETKNCWTTKKTMKPPACYR